MAIEIKCSKKLISVQRNIPTYHFSEEVAQKRIDDALAKKHIKYRWHINNVKRQSNDMSLPVGISDTKCSKTDRHGLVHYYPTFILTTMISGKLKKITRSYRVEDKDNPNGLIRVDREEALKRVIEAGNKFADSVKAGTHNQVSLSESEKVALRKIPIKKKATEQEAIKKEKINKKALREEELNEIALKNKAIRKKATEQASIKKTKIKQKALKKKALEKKALKKKATDQEAKKKAKKKAAIQKRLAIQNETRKRKLLCG